jgi:putative Ca2+/H+ antiporter (TMEM165/GDT1 family)
MSFKPSILHISCRLRSKKQTLTWKLRNSVIWRVEQARSIRKFFRFLLCYFFVFRSTTWQIISFVSTIFLKSFTLTFVAEWGDRSQITTIILGARENVVGVITGGVLGHALCTGIAVVFGRLLAKRLSVRTG